MAILNISRQPFSRGDEIADEIAHRLNYKLVDKSVINNKVRQFHCNFSDELHDLADEKEPGFFKHFFRNPVVYNCLLQAILFEEAANGDVVIKGRGGQFILDDPFVLNLRLIAPFEMRRLQLESQKQMNRDMAHSLLGKKDHERDNFIQYLFKRDISDASAYDIVFNHQKLSKLDIIDSILDSVRRLDTTHVMSETDRIRYRCRALEKRVEASIRKEFSEYVHLNVVCTSPGDVTIQGFVADELERTSFNKLAQACNGVQHVNCELETIRLHKPK